MTTAEKIRNRTPMERWERWRRAREAELAHEGRLREEAQTEAALRWAQKRKERAA